VKKLLSMSIVLALVLSFSLVATTPVAASTTHYVNPGDSIQVAIDGANPGDTIMVAAGVYAEFLEVDKSLSLLGPNAGNPGYGARGDEAVILPPVDAPFVDPYGLYDAVMITVAAENVVIDGFTLRPRNPDASGEDDYQAQTAILGDGRGLVTEYVDVDGFEVRNNIIEGFPDMGVWVSRSHGQVRSDGPITGVVVEGNYIKESYDGFGFGFYLQGTIGHVLNNTVEEVMGNQIQPYDAVAASGEGLVSGNAISVRGIALYHNYDEKGGHWTYSGNTVTRDTAATWWHGIRIQTIYDDPTLIFTGNTIDGAGAAGADFVGVKFQGRVDEAACDNLDFSGNELEGLFVFVEDGSTGQHVDLAPILTENAFVPAAGIDDNRIIAFRVHNVTQDTLHTTIQEAIDEAEDSDTIEVRAGTYEENVDLLDKWLTIKGIVEDGVVPTLAGTLYINQAGVTDAGPTTIEYMNFVAVDHGNPYQDPHVNSIIIRNANDVTIRHCHFDGAGRFMESPYSRSAVNADHGSSDITVDSCIIENGYYMGIHVRAVGGGTDTLSVKNSVIDNVKSGINFVQGSNLVVENTDISIVAQGEGNDSYCVRFAARTVVATDMTITGGTFTVDRAGFSTEPGTYHAAIVTRDLADGDLKVSDANILGEVVNLADTVILDAGLNWWGSDTGPFHVVLNPGGEGGPVSDNVDFIPWHFLEELLIPITSYVDVETETGTGTAKFGASAGDIEDLVAVSVPPDPPAGIEFPHGMFEFEITGLTLGETVTVTIELPSAVPAGTEWWKYHDDQWYSLPIGTTADPRVITIALTDGGLGDAGVQDGTIVDPGGPGNPPPLPPVVVGWEGSPVNRLAVMAPWMALFAAIMAGAVLLVARRRRAQM